MFRSSVWALLAATLGLGSSACEPEPGYVIDVEAERVVIAPGDSATVRIDLQRRPDNDDVLALDRVDGLPQAATATFDPTEFPAGQRTTSSTMTITIDVETPAGEHDLSVVARTEDGRAVTTGLELIVTDDPQALPVRDFALSVEPAERVFTEPRTAFFQVRVRPLERFAGTVDLELSGLTDDFDIRRFPASLTIPEASGAVSRAFDIELAPVGPVDEKVVLTVTATGPDSVHTRKIRLTVRLPAIPEPVDPEPVDPAQPAEPVAPAG